MKKFFKLFLIFFLTAILLCVILNSEVYVKSAFEGLKLWAVTVLPALLPFFFFTSLLSALGLTSFICKIAEKPCKFLFNTSGYGAYAFTLSILSGYPVGAKVIADLYENDLIDSAEATKMSAFCSTSGPAFVIASVGIGMFGDRKIAFFIFASHILSAIICGIIFRFIKSSTAKNTNLTVLTKKTDNVLYESVYSSVISVCLVGGFICVFSLISDVLLNLNALSPIVNLFSLVIDRDLASAFTYGFIECTKGCKAISLCNLSTYSPAFACFLISFGGASIWAQSIIFLKKAKANIKIFCLSKILQAIISFIFCLLFLWANI